MSRILVDALERILAGNLSSCVEGECYHDVAREALAAHRATPLAGDSELRDKVATWLVSQLGGDDDMGPGERAAYGEDADAVLRIIDEHLRGGR